MTPLARARGIAALLCDAVEHGSRAVERIQLETARRPFGILERIPGIADPARLVHGVFEASVTGVHRSIRAVNGVVGATVEFALENAEKDRQT